MIGIDAVQRAQESLDNATFAREATRLRATASVAPGRESLPPVSRAEGPDAVKATISPSGTLLGRMSELSRADSNGFGQLMAQGAKEIRTGVEEGAFADPTKAKRVAESFDRAATSKDVQQLDRSAFGSPQTGQSGDEKKLTDALQPRVDAALGMRDAPPFGPWFPREKFF